MNPPRIHTMKATQVKRTLKPGQQGTLKLLRHYGETLVCVRYRESIDGRTRYTTVELTIDTAPVQRRMTERTIVGVRIAWTESDLRARAKALGAHWDTSARRWRMSYKIAKALDLTDRIDAKLAGY